MLSVENLKSHEATARQNLMEMQRIIDGANAKLAPVLSDSSRTEQFKNGAILEVQKAVSPRLIELFGEINRSNELVFKSKSLYENVKFMLSRVSFDQNPVSDAAIRSAKLNELQLMDEPIRQMVAEIAAEEKRLPLLWLSILAGAKVDLSEIQTQEQIAGCELIKKFEALHAKGELLMRSGGISPFAKVSSSQKLSLARKAEAA